MPLVKGIQNKLGKDKFEVLLLSVDAERNFCGENPADADRKSLKEVGVDWENVLVPGGFETLLRRYNLDGYGLVLIDPNGIVRGVNLRADEVKKLIK